MDDKCRKERLNRRSCCRIVAKTRVSDKVIDVSPRKSMRRFISKELRSESMGTQGCCSGFSISGARSTGVIPDDCSFETLNHQGMRALKSPTRAGIGKATRRHSFRIARESQRLSTSASASQQIKSGGSGIQDPCGVEPDIENRISNPENESQSVDRATRPSLQRSRSTPVAVHGQIAAEVPNGACNSAHHEPVEQNIENDEPLNPHIEQSVELEDADSLVQEMFKQPAMHPITEEQLINEVRGIFTGLIMVEKKCIEIDRRQSQTNAALSPTQWKVLVSVHRTLLYEHHDFLLASQHPSASPVVKQLATQYAMPARMWRFGVHSFLELLRQKLPGSMDYMLDFIYLSYSMMTLLLESVPDFKETWIECLGDLARYRMAVEEFDKKDRDFWAGVSRYWYNQDAGGSTDNGRMQHHLAVLARPDVLQQFFHYTKALISVSPFPNALNSMVQLVHPLLDLPAHKQNLTTAFVTTHSALFVQEQDRPPVEEFVSRATDFLATLRTEISRVDRDGQQGVQITCCNIAAIFQYGDKNGVMEKDFALRHNPTAEDRLLAMQWTSNAKSMDGSVYTDISSQLVFRASSLAFHTLIIMLGQVDDTNMHPSVHVSMAFVWCLTLNPAAIQRLEPLIPWSLLAAYLNTLFNDSEDISKIEDEAFPLDENEAIRQLPEDFLIRGQAWSQVYFPKGFFEGAPTEDERLSITAELTVNPRRHRCLWLGVRIATFTRWMTYDQTRRFTPTKLAHELAPIAESPAHLFGNIHSLGPETSYSDLDMQEV